MRLEDKEKEQQYYEELKRYLSKFPEAKGKRKLLLDFVQRYDRKDSLLAAGDTEGLIAFLRKW